MFQLLTFDYKATNNILVSTIVPKDLQLRKKILKTSRNTNCDKKKNIKMQNAKKTMFKPLTHILTFIHLQDAKWCNDIFVASLVR